MIIQKLSDGTYRKKPLRDEDPRKFHGRTRLAKNKMDLKIMENDIKNTTNMRIKAILEPEYKILKAIIKEKEQKGVDKL